MNFDYLIYKDEYMTFKSGPHNFVTFLGDKNKTLVDNFLFIKENSYLTVDNYQITNKNLDKLRNVTGFAIIDQIDTFVAETVMDELAFNLESQALGKGEIKSKIKEISELFKLNKYLEKSPITLDRSSKALLSIARVVISSPKILILDNILKELDKSDLKLVVDFLNEYSKDNIVLNFTTEIEETLLGKRIVVTGREKVLIEGETLSVLNEEKIMKRLGFGLPFITLLNKYLKDYDLINKYYLDFEKLGGALWK